MARLAVWLALPLQVVLLAGLMLVLYAIVAAGRRAPPAPAGFLVRFLSAGLVLLFVCLAVYQAYWQLFGFLHPEFIDVVRRYDRRLPGIAATYRRGTVSDRSGAVLAESTPGAGPGERRYPEGPAACHIVGYDHPVYGRAGVEAARDPYLMGRSIGSPAELSRLVSNALLHRRLRGNALQLTLDAELQRAAWSGLRRRTGAVVVIDVDGGDLLVCCSRPGFDPGAMDSPEFRRQLAGGSAPMLNRGLAGLYPPGSTFKFLVAAQALACGVRRSFVCEREGFAPLPGARRIRDHEAIEGPLWPGHGELELGPAMAVSSNTYFAQLGVSLGSQGLRQIWEAFALDRPVWLLEPSSRGPGLAAAAGRMPELPPGDLEQVALLAIGQGDLLVSPLQMALAAAGVAAAGRIPEPRLTRSGPPRLRAQALPPEVAAETAALLRGVVTGGTARELADLPLAVAGKTGTAENAAGPPHSWFVGFAPVEAPRLALAVVIENAGYGSEAAVPLAEELLRRAIERGLLAPAERP